MSTFISRRHEKICHRETGYQKTGPRPSHLKTIEAYTIALLDICVYIVQIYMRQILNHMSALLIQDFWQYQAITIRANFAILQATYTVLLNIKATSILHRRNAHCQATLTASKKCANSECLDKRHECCAKN